MSAKQTNSATARPLEGIKVLDFCWAAVGPISTRFLADFGATVIKVESANWPDTLRTGGPFKDGIPGLDRSGFFALYNSNKYSLALNLNHPRSNDLIWQLIGWADLVADNFGAGMMDRRGFSYEEIIKVKPDTIVIRSSNQGQTGPHARDGGFGSHVLGLSGLGYISGWPDRLPSHVSIGYVDVLGGFVATMAVLGALDYRRRTGQGQYIDLSQLESVIPLLAPLVLDWTANGRDAVRSGNRCVQAAPHGAYPCRGDDSWCAIAVFTDEEWQAFRHCIGAPPWAQDPRFSTLPGRKENEDELDLLVGQWTRERSAEEVMTALQAGGVPAGRVLNGQGLINDPQLAHRGHHVKLEGSEVGVHHIPNWGFRSSETPPTYRAAAPFLGEHTELVCRDILGMSDEEFVELLADGAFE